MQMRVIIWLNATKRKAAKSLALDVVLPHGKIRRCRSRQGNRIKQYA
jgi:hypothetical protein